MVNTRTPKRGDILKLSFGPSKGHEQDGYRPVVVLSDIDFHTMTGFAFCVPVTTRKKELLFEITVDTKSVQGVALPHAAKMLDLHARKYQIVDRLSQESLEQIVVVLTKIMVG